MGVIKKSYKIIILLTVFLSLVTIPLVNYLSQSLATKKSVKANILLVEGWISPNALTKAYNEYINNNYELIITTGLNSPDYCQISNNGNLVFYTDEIFGDNNLNGIHTIETRAFSQLDGEYRAHFNVFANDSLLTDFFAEKDFNNFGVAWRGSLSDIDSITIQFDNDMMGGFGDCNLYVSHLIIDDSININFQHNTIYKISDSTKERWILYNYSSYADIAKIILLEYGVDSTKVISMSGGKAIVNRTLTSTYAFRDWLNKTIIEVNGINIFTEGPHAYRTFMIYKSILPKEYPVGIISYSDTIGRDSGKRLYFNTLREIFAIGYYKIVLLFNSVRN